MPPKKKKPTELRLIDFDVEPRIPACHKLVQDHNRLFQLTELAKAGASLATIEAKLNISEGRLSVWLAKGKGHKSGPYRYLYDVFRASVADARAVAEATMVTRSPEKYLTTNSSARVVENQIIQAEQSAPTQLNIGEQLIQSLVILRRQGISINDAIDKGQLSITNQFAKDEPDDHS